jgi:hypothetical protein
MKNSIIALLALAATAAGQIYQPPASTDITDSTTVGRAVLTASNQAAAQTALGITLTNFAADPTFSTFTNTGNAVIGTNTTDTLTIGGTVTAAGATGVSGNAVANVGTLDSRYFINLNVYALPVDMAPSTWTLQTNGTWYDGTTLSVTNGVFMGMVSLFATSTNAGTNSCYAYIPAVALPIAGSGLNSDRGLSGRGNGLLVSGEFQIVNTNSNEYAYTRIMWGAFATNNLVSAIGSNAITTNGIVVEQRGFTNTASTEWRLVVWSTNGVTEGPWSVATNVGSSGARLLIATTTNTTKLYVTSRGDPFDPAAPVTTVTNVPTSAIAVTRPVAVAVGIVQTNTNIASRAVRIYDIKQMTSLFELGF